MKSKTDCLFCGKKWTLEDSVLIGKKYVCVDCLKRFSEMLNFFMGLE